MEEHLLEGLGGLTYAPGPIQRGEISLRTLAEVAANRVGALAHATKAWHVGTLVQVCQEEDTHEFTPPKHLKRSVFTQVDKKRIKTMRLESIRTIMLGYQRELLDLGLSVAAHLF